MLTALLIATDQNLPAAKTQGEAPKETVVTALVWFRNDLRLADNPALDAALASGRKILCVYIHDEQGAGLRPAGGASRWRLRLALQRLVRIAGPSWR